MKKYFLLTFLHSLLSICCYSQIYNTGNGQRLGVNCIEWQPPEILPLALLYFNVHCTNNEITVQWRTMSLLKTGDAFIVEKSKDGYSFETVKIVEVFESRQSSGLFTIVDKNEYSYSRLYYRLKYIDSKGKFIFSNVMSANCKAENNESNVRVYPNPTADLLYFKSSESLISISIKNMSGQLLFQTKPNTVQFTFNGKFLPAGIYIATVETRKGVQFERIVIGH